MYERYSSQAGLGALFPAFTVCQTVGGPPLPSDGRGVAQVLTEKSTL